MFFNSKSVKTISSKSKNKNNNEKYKTLKKKNGDSNSLQNGPEGDTGAIFILHFESIL